MASFEKIYWPFLPVIILIGCLTTLGLSSHTLPNALKHPTSKVLSYATQMNINDLLTDTNSMRTLNNLSTLSLNPQLDAAAQAKANDMATRNYWSHTTPEGNQPWTFVSNQNYSYRKLGENLAAGFSDPNSTIKGWMASVSHRENLLDPNFTEVGFGFANNSNYSAGGGPMTIVVAFYGRPESASAITSSVNPSFDLQQNSSSAPTNTLGAVSQKSQTKIMTRAQIVFFSIFSSRIATYLALTLMGLALGVWIGRHAFAVRRAIRQGESYVITHPLFDFSLLILAGLSYLLTKTAGLIT